MDTFKWVGEVETALAELKEANDKLCERILADSDYAFYWEDGEPVVDYPQARSLICEHLQRWNYTERPISLGCAAADAETLQLAHALNTRKAQWTHLHRQIRCDAGGGQDGAGGGESLVERLATEFMRRVLSLAGYGFLNLDATDRAVPVLPGTPLRINWHSSKSAPSARRKVKDVLRELSRIAETGEEPSSSFAQDEMARLSVLDQDTPVAHRAKRQVSSLRFRASCVINGRRKPAIGYGSNPILFPYKGITPELTVLEGKNAPGAGRPAAVSTERVTKMFDHYFWYYKLPQKKAKPRRAQNPFASTSFPGLWLGTRKRKNGLAALVMVQREDRSITSVSIGRNGLGAAWREAARIYCTGRGVKLESVLDAQPADSTVEQLLGWAQQHQ